MFMEPSPNRDREEDLSKFCLEYKQALRGFLPPLTQYHAVARALVPVICSLFDTHDAFAFSVENSSPIDCSHDLRLPWDVVGGVIAILFAVPVRTMTVAEYRKLFEDIEFVKDCKLDGPLRLRLVGTDSASGSLLIAPLPFPDGSLLTLDVSGIESVDISASASWTPALVAVLIGSSLRHETSTPRGLLSRNVNLVSVQIDANGMENVTHIHKDFARKCERLEAIDLTPLRNVKTIGPGFLKDCSSLQHIDLSPFKQVTEISSEFLAACTNLTVIDLSALRNVKTIGTDFLNGCSSLDSIDLTPLSRVTELRNSGFLFRCSRLKTIDLPPLLDAAEIDSYFLSDCNSLINIDLVPFTNVNTIRSFFLDDCSSLRRVDLSPFERVTYIGWSFLSGCQMLESIDLTPLTSLRKVYLFDWLRDCSRLAGVIDLTYLRNVDEVHDYDHYDPVSDQALWLCTPADEGSQVAQDFLKRTIRIRVPAENALVVDAVKDTIQRFSRYKKYAEVLTVEEVRNEKK